MTRERRMLLCKNVEEHHSLNPLCSWRNISRPLVSTTWPYFEREHASNLRIPHKNIRANSSDIRIHTSNKRVHTSNNTSHIRIHRRDIRWHEGNEHETYVSVFFLHFMFTWTRVMSCTHTRERSKCHTRALDTYMWVRDPPTKKPSPIDREPGTG